ncbi:MAG: hypothetical protein HYZ84_04615 [Candidatus Omnitrophica bacterium]|nr:hypothetical protein [Candidatus Omnitrophota bacterium]
MTVLPLKELSKPWLSPRIFLAVLPLLIFMSDLQSAFTIGFLTALHVWFTALFFKITARLYPDPLKKWALMIWIGVMTQIGFYIWHFEPLWAVSLYLLFPGEVFQKRPGKEIYQKIFWRGAGFCLIACSIGVFSEISLRWLSLSFLEHPCGPILILALLAVLAGKKPAREYA